MPERVGNIELYMGPQQVSGPDDLRQTIIDFIDGAKKKLDIAVHLTLFAMLFGLVYSQKHVHIGESLQQ